MTAASSKKLNLLDLTMIVVSLVIGMGIFRTPINVAKDVETPALFFLAWLLGGVVALCGALTYAEIGSRLPVTGGYYKVCSYAYHPSIAFAVNCLILVSNAASAAAVALVGSEYITGVLIPNSTNAEWLSIAANAQRVQVMQIIISAAAILLFYGINLLGLKMSARTQNVLTIIKICLILSLITPLFFATGSHTNVISGVINDQGMMGYLRAFGSGLVAVSFTYGGYQQTINFGAELEKPKIISRGIFYGIGIIILLYLVINYAYVSVIGFEELKTSKNIAAIMASKILGENAERVLSVLLFLSVLAYVNVQLMSNPRVMAAMTEDKILPLAFNRRNRKGALTVSLSVFAAMCLLVVFWAKEFDTILSFSIFLDCFGMVLTAGSIFIIRKRTRHLDNTGIYKMILYPLMPVIFISSYTFVAISLLINKTQLSLIGLAVLAAFIGIYFVVVELQKKKKVI